MICWLSKNGTWLAKDWTLSLCAPNVAITIYMCLALEKSTNALEIRRELFDTSVVNAGSCPPAPCPLPVEVLESLRKIQAGSLPFLSRPVDLETVERTARNQALKKVTGIRRNPQGIVQIRHATSTSAAVESNQRLHPWRDLVGLRTRMAWCNRK